MIKQLILIAPVSGCLRFCNRGKPGLGLPTSESTAVSGSPHAELAQRTSELRHAFPLSDYSSEHCWILPVATIGASSAESALGVAWRARRRLTSFFGRLCTSPRFHLFYSTHPPYLFVFVFRN